MSLPRYPEYKDSGVAWLGEVPAHWKISKFRHAFDESQEKIEQCVVGAMLSVSGYRGIEIKEYDDENRRRSDDDLIGYRIVRPGQLVINTMWLNYAGLGVSDHEGHVSPAYRSYWIESSFNKRFVHHMMRCGSFVLGYTKFLTGIRPNSLQMGRDDLMSFQILNPPAQEQDAIATFLGRETAKIDGLIAEQEKLITLLAEKRQATISHAVTKGLNPDVPMKDSGVAWLGEVPAHWRACPIKHLAKIGNGSTPNRDNPEYWTDEGYPWLNSSVANLEEVSSADQFVTALALRECHLPIITPPAVLVGITGQGKTRGMATTLMFEATVNQHLAYIKPQGVQVTVQFLRRVLEMAYDQLRTESEGAGSTKGAITCEQLGRLVIPLPNTEEQTKIVDFLGNETARLDALTAEATRGIELLKERRSALISAAVTGKIDVRHLAEAEAA